MACVKGRIPDGSLHWYKAVGSGVNKGLFGRYAPLILTSLGFGVKPCVVKCR